MIKSISFQNSIKPDVIQENFQYLDGRINREAIRTGGKGITEGFNLTVVGEDTVKVSSGVLIDKDGKEYLFGGEFVKILPIEPVQQTLYRLEVNAQGEILLPSRPYSRKRKGYLDTSSYLATDMSEIVVRRSNSTAGASIIKIDGSILTVDAATWAGRTVDVTFLYARNRMDKILFKDGRITVVNGIISPSLTIADEQDYSNHTFIGTVETAIDTRTSLVVSERQRQSRPVFVDENNIAHINGYEYRGLYFDKPDSPRVGDVYIDEVKGHVFSYVVTDYGYDWRLVNRNYTIPVIRKRLYTKEEVPADRKRFLFNKQLEQDLFFQPGLGALTIIIDNVPLMSDQYSEIIETTGDEEIGIGFELIEALDRDSYVEATINTYVEGFPYKSYQRTATFTKESIEIQDVTNTDQIFDTAIDYYMNENQLELFVEGARLSPDVDFKEITNELMYSSDKQLSKKVRILKPLTAGQRITLKVSRNVYTYDHIADLLENTLEKIGSDYQEIGEIQNRVGIALSNADARVTAMENSVGGRMEAIEGDLNALRTTVSNNTGLSNGAVGVAHLTEPLKAKLVKEPFEMALEAGGIVELVGVDINDFFIVHVISNALSRPLIRNVDYSVVQSNGNAILAINEEFNGFTILVSGIKFGIE